MDYQKFIEHCKAEGFVWCKIYSGKSLVASYPKGDADFDTEQLLKCIDEFANRLPGSYNIDLKRHKKTVKDDMRTLKSVTLGGSNALHAGQVDIEKIKTDLKKEIVADMKHAEKEKEKDEKIKELKIALKESRNPAEKLIFIGTEIALKLFPNQIKSISTIMATDNLQGNPKEDDTTNMTEENKYNAAFDIFEKLIDADTMLKLAKKVQKDPAILNIVKTFAG